MKLYLVWQDQNTSRDTYDSMVVAAEDEEVARDMQPYRWRYPEPAKLIDWSQDLSYSEWAYNRDCVLVREIGEALPGTPRSVICASFNAG